MQVIKNIFRAFSLVYVLFAASQVSAEDIYTIDDIFVSKSADSATQARALANSEAEGVAFDKLIRSIITDEDYKNLPAISKEDISAMVKGYEVKEERIAGNKYEARFSLTFFPHMVKKLLEENDIAVVEGKGAPTLLLPVYNYAGDSVLWDGDNQWRKAWEKAISERGAASLVLPVGDDEDMGLLKLEDIYSADTAVLDAIRKKYAAKNILIAEGSYDDTSFSGKASLDVVLRLIGEKGELEKQTAKFEGDYSTEIAGFIDSSVNDLMEKVEQSLLNASKNNAFSSTQEPVAEEANVVVDVPISGLNQWIEIRDKISKMDIVKKIEVLGLSAGNARIKMFYKQDFATFSYFLGVEGFNLKKSNSTDSWRLEPNKT